ncbi:hypothetical protein J3A84_02855 [Proteiniclasticum sp. SCR006]|uniref:Uncharacterized protein n=1 Tax=Proteiniclasticum aestuarii TaxID=2817862 RepID=A0A939KF12_9CLOT|nr:hypothetical protein [Proteiniclasticum aestuarii]MBO1263982.1 hypothetical protein [Proteiniclasticum aestuarii]
MYDYKENRVHGGSSYADAMYRFGATSEHYARRMTERTIEKEWGKDSPYRYFGADTFFIISRNDVPMIIKDYAFVEMHRCTAVHSFENWVKELVRKE